MRRVGFAHGHDPESGNSYLVWYEEAGEGTGEGARVLFIFIAGGR